MIELVSSKGSNDTYLHIAMLLVGVVAQKLHKKVLAPITVWWHCWQRAAFANDP
jgi:hypothetical protein